MTWERSLATLTERGWQRRDVIDALLRLLRSPEFRWCMSTREVERAVGRRLDDPAARAVLAVARTWLLGGDGERNELVQSVRLLDG